MCSRESKSSGSSTSSTGQGYVYQSVNWFAGDLAVSAAAIADLHGEFAFLPGSSGSGAFIYECIDAVVWRHRHFDVWQLSAANSVGELVPSIG